MRHHLLHRLPRAVACTVTLAFASAFADAPEDERAAVERVRALYAQVNTVVESGRAQASFLAADMDHYDEGPWRVVKSEAACWKVPDDPGDNYERYPVGCATVWRLDGRVVRTRVETTSPSGDWVTHVEYTFWPDGRVAFRFEEYRAAVCVLTGEGEDAARFDGCGEDRREYRDERGRVVRTLHQRWAEQGKRRLPAPTGLSFPHDNEEPHHARLSDLPFAAQLK